MTTRLDDPWIQAGDHLLRLEGTDIIARNAQGTLLTTVPPAAKKHQAYEQLDAQRSFLAQHADTCRTTVRTWFLAGLPVPVSVLTAVWPDETWRAVLTDLVITDGTLTGFLRDADEHTLHLIDLDGESIQITRTDEATINIPHPVTLDELVDWREFAVQLGIHQDLDQLFRHTVAKPAAEQARKDALNAYRKGSYERAGHLIGRARGAGFTASFTGVGLRVEEAGRSVRVELAVTAYLPEEPAELGALFFTVDGAHLDPADVGPVAWSEGVRMADYVWAGRTVQEENQ